MRTPFIRNFTALHAYPFMRPLLFRLDAEDAHNLALTLLKRGFGPQIKSEYDAILHTEVCGMSFANPIGLAAGFDKNAEVIEDVLGFGFGFAEIGSITPLPQPGNPRPRMFRAVNAKGVINRLGFNSHGMDACLPRMIAYRDANPNVSGIVGINIGKNKDSADAASDYVTGIKKFSAYANYITVNISSPNTPGLRDLQSREQLADLLKQVMDARNAAQKQIPIFVKIAPDQTEQQMDDIAEVALASGIHGMIVGNTTVSRPGNLPAQLASENGGLSGKPLFELSTRILGGMYKRLGGKLPIIGCGGVASGADAYAKIRAGASVVQLYSALVYEGPGLVSRINRELAALLRRDGFTSLKEAIGSGKR